MITKHQRLDLNGRAARIASLWKRIDRERPNLTFWAKARIMSEKIDCQLRKLPVDKWITVEEHHLLGQTDGRLLHVRSFKDKVHEAFVFFHEVGHVLLHYGTEKRWRVLTTVQKEIEADDFATAVCMSLWPEHVDIYKKLAEGNVNR